MSLTESYSQSYGWQKFFDAMHTLALGRGDKRERLINSQEHFMTLRPEENLPEEIQEEYREFREDIIAKGSVLATVGEMDEDEVNNMITRLIGMYDTVARHQEPFLVE